jgi:hypothetical protein
LNLNSFLISLTDYFLITEVGILLERFPLLLKGRRYDIEIIQWKGEYRMKKKTSLISLSVFFIMTIFSFWCLQGIASGDARNLSKFSIDKKNEVKEWLEVIINELESTEDNRSKNTFDGQTVILEVGTDPIKLFEWVRDNTFWVPYQGSLRGAAGVLMDRLGNSLDRSLLLADLLHSAGFQARLAHVGLSDNRARGLWDDIQKISDTQVFSETAYKGMEISQFENIALRVQMNTQEMQQGLKQLSQINNKNDREAKQRVKDQVEMLMETIGELKAEGEISEQMRIEALRDHWWVQYETEESWVDLDPLLPQGKPGETVEEPEETVEIDDLDEALLHLITVRVVAEQWKDGYLDEHTSFEHTLRPSELFGKRIILYNLSLNWPEDLRLDEEEFAERFRDAILEAKEWMLVFEVGPDMIVQSSFTDKGGINENPNPTPEAEAGGATRGVFRGVTGGLMGGSRKDEDEEKGYLTAGWLEYDLHLPGQDDQTIRRELFDLLGPAARSTEEVEEPDFSDDQKLERGYCLFGIIEILPVVCQISPQFADQVTSQYCVDQLRILQEELEDDNPVENLNIRIGRAAEALHSPLFKWALLRPRWNQYVSSTYFGSINVVNLRTRIVEAASGEFLLRRIFDIVNNDISIFPQATSSPAMARLNQGVADTVAEAMIIPGPKPHMNLNYLIDLAKDQQIGWRLAKEIQHKDWEKWRLSEDVRARIEGTLMNGWAVVVPERPITVEGKPRLGWWSVNLESGETLAVMDTGFHQDTTEYTEEQWAQIRTNCVNTINTLHKATRGGPAPFPLPSNMSFADFIELFNYQNWKYLDPERVLRLWELAKMSGALAGL